MSPTVRPPAVAGAFYPDDPAELRAALDRSFRGPRGPGSWPTRRANAPGSLRAIVVPHAGYVYSGPIAARAYLAVGEQPPPEAVLLLGVDHHGSGAPFAVSGIPWATPLGVSRVADSLVAALVGGPIERDEVAHRREHSLEVQLPFLQAVLPDVPVAALSVRFDRLEVLERVAERVAGAVAGRRVLLVASTDFSHYVPAETARRLDALAVDRIRARDGPGLYEVVTAREISMCGIAPTTVALLALSDEALEATSLGWGHSGEAEPMREVVGYAALRLDRVGPGRAP